MHPDVLSKKGKVFFPLLKNFSDFYIGGGTALALQIGHRISVDFDSFTAKKIQKNLLSKVENVFRKSSVRVAVNNTDELTVFIDKHKMTFLKYPFPVLFNFVIYKGVRLLDLREIAVTKAYTIGRRGMYKDYIDLYFILSKGYISINEIIKLSEKKYKDEFNSRLFLEQLIYLDDVEDAQILFLKKSVSRTEIKKFFIEQVKEIKL